MTNETVDIDIGKKAQQDDGVTENKDGTFSYNDSSGKGVTLRAYSNPSGLYGYEKLVHTPKGGRFVGKIKKRVAPQSGFSGTLSEYSSVTVFYWSLDSTFRNPLVIQLGKGNDGYYFAKGGSNDTWTKFGIKSTLTLSNILDRLNCSKNSAHVIEISQDDETEGYRCPGCNTSINQSSGDVTGCNASTLTYTLNGGKIGKLVCKGETQRGISVTSGFNKATVYSYPKTNGNSLLIYFFSGSKHNWYVRKSINGNEWGEVPESKTLGDGSSNLGKIRRPLEEAYGGSGGSLLSYLGQALGGTVVTGTLGFGGHKILAVLWPLV